MLLTEQNVEASCNTLTDKYAIQSQSSARERSTGSLDTSMVSGSFTNTSISQGRSYSIRTNPGRVHNQSTHTITPEDWTSRMRHRAQFRVVKFLACFLLKQAQSVALHKIVSFVKSQLVDKMVAGLQLYKAEGEEKDKEAHEEQPQFL